MSTMSESYKAGLEDGARKVGMFGNLSTRQLNILEDALDYWGDKDRHGELETGYGYTKEDQEALWEMISALRNA